MFGFVTGLNPRNLTLTSLLILRKSNARDLTSRQHPDGQNVLVRSISRYGTQDSRQYEIHLIPSVMEITKSPAMSISAPCGAPHLVQVQLYRAFDIVSFRCHHGHLESAIVVEGNAKVFIIKPSPIFENRGRRIFVKSPAVLLNG
jgi:hypothetical protein